MAYKNSEKIIHEMIRVDHAGEYGAKRIYEGQLQALKGHPIEPVIRHMYDQELAHLKAFEGWMIDHAVRPTILSPLWHGAGYALGWVSGKLGSEAAMAVTVAVEDVIDQHYAEQLKVLDSLNNYDDIKQGITQFREEELDHKNQGLMHDAESAPLYPLLSRVVRLGTQLAIALSKKI